MLAHFENLIKKAYPAFNLRNIDTTLSIFHSDVQRHLKMVM